MFKKTSARGLEGLLVRGEASDDGARFFETS